MTTNEMPDPKVVRAENREQLKAEALARKSAFKRLAKNKDFKIFYDYLETCYNSYIESGGDSQIPKDMRDHLLVQGATLHKVLKYIDRQSKD